MPKVDLDREAEVLGFPKAEDAEPFEIESEMDNIKHEQFPSEGCRVDQLWPSFVELLRARAAGELPVVSTGLRTLDEMLGGGLPAGQVTLICGSPGVGKTSIGLDWGFQYARAGGRVVIWSLELPIPLVLARLVCQETSAPWSKVLAGACLADTAATGKIIQGVDLHVVDTPGDAGEAAVRALLPALKNGERPHLLIIDYLQLLAQGGGDQRGAVEHASAKILAIAKQTGAAVLAISSTGRASYDLGSQGEPDLLRVLAMARDSGVLEFNGAAVIGLIRAGKTDPESSRYHGAWCSLAKSRLGTTGNVGLEIDGQAGTAHEADIDLFASSVADEAVAKRIFEAVELAQATSRPLTSVDGVTARVKGRAASVREVLKDLLRTGRLDGGRGRPFVVLGDEGKTAGGEL